jgi:hypothetical protein
LEKLDCLGKTSHINFDLCCIFKNLILVPVPCFENAGFGENAFASRACRLGPKLKIASEWLTTEIEFLIF